MRTLAALGAVSLLVLASAPDLTAKPSKPSRPQRNGHARLARTPFQTISARLVRAMALRTSPSQQQGTAPSDVMSSLELDIVGRINAQRRARGLRVLRISHGLTAAASYHSRQMGALGFFEHESSNGAPFWRRIQRFYPARRGYWSVGENLFWESPDTDAASAVREWMQSPPHRQNILTREWREIGVGAVHLASAPGAFGGRSVTILTADFGVRR